MTTPITQEQQLAATTLAALVVVHLQQKELRALRTDLDRTMAVLQRATLGGIVTTGKLLTSYQALDQARQDLNLAASESDHFQQELTRLQNTCPVRVMTCTTHLVNGTRDFVRANKDKIITAALATAVVASAYLAAHWGCQT